MHAYFATICSSFTSCTSNLMDRYAKMQSVAKQVDQSKSSLPKEVQKYDERFSKGDQLKVAMTDYLRAYHHGIYLGKETIIDFNTTGVHLRKLEEFAGDKEVEKVDNENKFPPNKICKRAFSYWIGEKDFGKYNFIVKNCEHFANVCSSGRDISHQVRDPRDIMYSIIDNMNEIVQHFPIRSLGNQLI